MVWEKETASQRQDGRDGDDGVDPFAAVERKLEDLVWAELLKAEESLYASGSDNASTAAKKDQSKGLAVQDLHPNDPEAQFWTMHHRQEEEAKLRALEGNLNFVREWSSAFVQVRALGKSVCTSLPAHQPKLDTEAEGTGYSVSPHSRVTGSEEPPCSMHSFPKFLSAKEQKQRDEIGNDHTDVYDYRSVYSRVESKDPAGLYTRSCQQSVEAQEEVLAVHCSREDKSTRTVDCRKEGQHRSKQQETQIHASHDMIQDVQKFHDPFENEKEKLCRGGELAERLVEGIWQDALILLEAPLMQMIEAKRTETNIHPERAMTCDMPEISSDNSGVKIANKRKLSTSTTCK